MKKTLTLITGIVITSTALILNAQELVPRRDAVRMAAYLNFDLSIFDSTPIPSDADVKRPVAYREGEYAALIVPESKLSAETFSKIGNNVVPIGQIWLHKIVPVKNGQELPANNFQKFPITIREENYEVMLCLLGARKNPEGNLELLVYGKDKEPLLILPLKQSETKQQMPIEADVQREDYSAKVTLKIAGKYQAILEVTATSD